MTDVTIYTNADGTTIWFNDELVESKDVKFDINEKVDINDIERLLVQAEVGFKGLVYKGITETGAGPAHTYTN